MVWQESGLITREGVQPIRGHFRGKRLSLLQRNGKKKHVGTTLPRMMFAYVTQLFTVSKDEGWLYGEAFAKW